MDNNHSKYLPKQENKISSSANSDIYFYCDEDGAPIFKSKEVNKKEKRIIFFPYSVNTGDGSVKSKRIQMIEFVGWEAEEDIPDDFKVVGKYGLRTQRAKAFFNVLYFKYRDANHFTIGINIQTSFKSTHITLNWPDLKIIFNDLFKEKKQYDREKLFLINRNLSKINTAIIKPTRVLPAGDLQRFLAKYDSFEKINSSDLNALSSVMDLIPPSVINTTSNFINSKQSINKVYIEDLIDKFEKLMSASKDNEKQWQDFFEKNAWILSHLFPFEVILREKEAYVGGKTIGNDDGRVLDFLFENGFQDNYAMLEVKTHKKELLKKQPYRKPAAFAMTDDLSGGISQCLDQKDNFIKDFGKQYPSFDPKCILIIGRKNTLSTIQKTSFELLRSSQKNVDIVTFDEILTKLKGLMNVLNINN